MTPTDDHDFSLNYLRNVEAITREYRVSPHATFAIQCETAAAAHIRQADPADDPRLDEKLETLKHTDSGAIAYFMARGALAHLNDNGVTKEYVQEYMERRIAEFENAARPKNATNRRNLCRSWPSKTAFGSIRLDN